MRKWLNGFFTFTKGEFNGLLVLVALIVLVTAAPYAYALVHKQKYDPGDQLIVKRLILSEELDTKYAERSNRSYDSRYNSSTQASSASGSAQASAPGSAQAFTTGSAQASATAAAKNFPTAKGVRLFRFNPNTIKQAQWMELGLSEKQAAAVIRYLAKGGAFRSVEDLQKMYTISAEMYAKLSPYVDIKVPKPLSTNKVYPEFKSPSFVKKPLTITEINGADSAALDDIRGIGPAFAIRILQYRERVGGFVNKAQLMEVFGLDSAKYLEIQQQITVNVALIRKININTVQAEDFKNHPYLRYKQINALIQYRKQHGNYGNIADLAKVLVIPSETITRLAPYLTF